MTPNESFDTEIIPLASGGVVTFAPELGLSSREQRLLRDGQYVGPLRDTSYYRAHSKGVRLWILTGIRDGSLSFQDFVKYVFKSHHHFRGGPLELPLKISAKLRGDLELSKQLPRYLEKLTSAAFCELREYCRDGSATTERLVHAYVGLRVAATLSPALTRDALDDNKRELIQYSNEDPLVRAVLARAANICEVPGANCDALTRWRTAFSDGDVHAACYVAQYFSPPRISTSILGHLARRDGRAALQCLKHDASVIREACLQEADANCREERYKQDPQWAASNFLRVLLVLKVTPGKFDLTAEQTERIVRVRFGAVAERPDNRWLERLWWPCFGRAMGNGCFSRRSGLRSIRVKKS